MYAATGDGIYVLDGSQAYYNLQSFLKKDTGSSGQVTVEAAVSVPKVDLLIHIKDYSGEKLYNKRFEDLDATSPITVELPEVDHSKDIINQTNITSTNQTNTTSDNVTNTTAAVPAQTLPAASVAETKEKTTSVTGNVASSGQGKTISTNYY